MSESPLIDSYSWNIGILSAAVSSVKLEVRPVAEATIPLYMMNEAAAYAERAGLNARTVQSGETHVKLYIYKHSHLSQIIERALEHDNDSLLSHWIWGHLFGYSEAEIGRYIREKLLEKIVSDVGGEEGAIDDSPR